jgi:NAD(P)H-flavin reductase
VILDEDLTEFEKAGKLCYFPVVQNPDENWVYGQGRISEAMIKSFMPDSSESLDDSLIIVCGPPKLKDEMKRVIVDEMGYTNTFFFN